MREVLLHNLSVIASVPVEFLETPTEINAKEGDTIELECVASGFPLPAIRWLRNNQLVMIAGRISESQESSLIISEAQVQDAGVYVCEANNGVGPAQRRRISVEVLGGYLMLWSQIPSGCIGLVCSDSGTHSLVWPTHDSLTASPWNLSQTTLIAVGLGGRLIFSRSASQCNSITYEWMDL